MLDSMKEGSVFEVNIFLMSDSKFMDLHDFFNTNTNLFFVLGQKINDLIQLFKDFHFQLSNIYILIFHVGFFPLSLKVVCVTEKMCFFTTIIQF